MKSLSQENSPLVLSLPPGFKGLVATGIKGWERIGEGFEFELRLVSTKDDAPGLSALLGLAMGIELTLPGGASRAFHGEVFKVSSPAVAGDYRHLVVTLRPRLARLGLVRRSRVFQEMSPEEILSAVLEPVGGAEFKISRNTCKKLYCVQYRETDLEFFRRICGEAGITYYWKHSLRDHRLTLVTDTTRTEIVAVERLESDVGGTATRCAFWEWETCQQMVNGEISIQDSHPELSSITISACSARNSSLTVGDVPMTLPPALAPDEADHLSVARQFDVFDSSGKFLGERQEAWFDAQEDHAHVMAIAASSGAVRARATGNAAHIQPGQAFRLEDLDGAQSSWLAVGQSHEVVVEGRFWEGQNTNLKLQATLESAPLELAQLIWPVPRRPEVAVVLTARVTGPQGQEVFLDPLGRVKVKFDWERASPGDEGSSAWVRVAQAWAGKGYGTFFWPRVGNEVLVAFESGDPDRPVVIGSLYNCVNTPPYDLPACSYVSGIKTSIRGDTSGSRFQQVIMSDDPSSPVLHLHSDTQILMHQNREQQSTIPDSSFEMRG